MIWVFLTACLQLCVGEKENITLIPSGNLVSTELPLNIEKQLVADDFTKETTDFFVPQCHAQQHNFTFIQNLEQGSVRETDSSVGDVIYSGTLPLSVVNKDDNSTFSAYCTYTTYPNTAPIPGGCNLEFNFESDPNLHSWYDGFRLWVQFQYAGIDGAKCDDKTHWNRLTYTIYAFHFGNGVDNSEKTFTESLSKFILVSEIKEKGTRLVQLSREDGGKPAIVVTSYPDQAMFIGIVVYDNVTNQESAYVSKVSYGCDIHTDDPDHPCQVQWYFYLMATVIGVAGLFITFFGHRFFTIELFIMGCLSGLLCGFIMLALLRVSLTGLLAGSAGIAVGVGILWFLVWQGAGIAILSLVLTAANAGFLINSIIMYTPLVNASIFQNSWEIWIFYAVAILLVFLLTVMWAKKLNILICSFLGTYAVIAAISVYCNASLHHIIIEPIRRAVIDDYYNSIFSAPFGVADGLLVGTWVVLTTAGAITQFCMERRKPDFPVSPRKKRRSLRLHAQLEERERLLNPSNQSSLRHTPGYGATTG